MEEIEVQIFDEINDYKEKIGIMTFRQWIFAALIVVLAIPTYILLPKYTFINSDIASYIVIIEAGILGFIGFVKIHNLSAEKIIPYWYRHYFVFNKPIKYMAIKEYQAQQEEKKNKHKKNKIITIENNGSELTPKQKKAKAKQDKALKKAKKKYGYMFKEDTTTEIEQENLNKGEVDEPVAIAVEKEKQQSSKSSGKPVIDEPVKAEPSAVTEATANVDEDTPTANNKDEIKMIDEGYKVLESMTEDERKALMKLLGGLSNH